MSAYTASEKALHRFYLKNYFIARSSLELEQTLFGNKLEKSVPDQSVFITGLARSGTTALMRQLFATEQYASLQYSNMPILLAPNLWNKKFKIDPHERAHGDGIVVDGNSPEEFDEFFWKAFLKDSYITSDGLVPHNVSKEVMDKFRLYTQLICLSKGKRKYISKNNNNILRLKSLLTIPGNKIIVLFRDPISHASSLLKLHMAFSASQTRDTFELEYFNFLGHHEFGLGHKPFLLHNEFIAERHLYPIDSLEYWVLNWVNYYEFLANQLQEEVFLLAFEDLTQSPAQVFSKLSTILDLPVPISIPDRHSPTKYSNQICEPKLREQALDIYHRLKKQSMLS